MARIRTLPPRFCRILPVIPTDEHGDRFNAQRRASNCFASLRSVNRARAQRSANLAGSTALQTSVLEDLQSAVNYREWLAGLTAPWLGDRPLEIGSGLGDYAAL